MKNLFKFLIISFYIIIGLLIANTAFGQFEIETKSTLSNPCEILVDSDSNYYVMYKVQQKVIKYDVNFQELFSISFSSSPQGMELDENEDLYVANSELKKYSKIDGAVLSHNMPPISSNFYYTDIHINDSNKFFILDNNHRKCHVFDSLGNSISSFTFVGGICASYALVTDTSENIYIAKRDSNRVSKFDINGNLLANLAVSNPYSVDINEQNTLFVTSGSTHSVKIYDLDFNHIQNIGSAGSGIGKFYWPYSSRVFGSRLCVADAGNSRIQLFELNPEVSVSSDVELESGDTINFGNLNVLSVSDSVRVAITNLSGFYNLQLEDQGGYYIELTGSYTDHYILDESALNPEILIDDTTYFYIKFAPKNYGQKKVILKIRSNDTDESVFKLTLLGTGQKRNQTITFDPIPQLTYGDAPVTVSATASSGLNITQYWVNGGPATMTGNTLTINGAGQVTITAYQAGNGVYRSKYAHKYITVNKADQTIDFPPHSITPYLDTMVLQATASSGLPITYTSADTNIAKIVDTLLIAKGVGSTNITASQMGNNNYNAAPDSVRTIATTKAMPSLIFTNPFATPANRQYGAKFKLEAASNSTAALKILVDDASILKITGDSAEVIGIGSSEVFAYVMANNLFKYAEVAHNFSTIKADQVLTHTPIPTLTYGQKYIVDAVISSGLKLSYSSSDENIFTISDSLLTVTGVGEATLTISQAGNQFYKALPDSVITITTVKANPAISFTSSGSKQFGDAKFKLIASDASGLPFTFSSSDESILSIDGDSATILDADTVLIYASRTGNEYYESLTVSQQLIIQKGTQEITFDALPEISYKDTSFNLVASVSTGNNIAFSIDNDSVVVLNNNQLQVIGAGTVNVTATVNATEKYSEALATQTLVVGKAAQNLTIADIPVLTYGDKAIKLSASSSADLMVSLQSDNDKVAIVQNDSLFVVGAGTFNLVASQSGNKNYSTATLSKSITINKADQQITYTKPTNAVYGTTFNLSAQATSGLPVSFTSKNTKVLAITDSTAKVVGVDSVEVQITQAGNTNYNAVQASFKILTQKAQQSILFGALDTMTYGASVVLVAEASSGLPVSYTSSDENIATINHDTLNVVGVGEVKIIAHQAGNGFYHAADTVIQSLLTLKKEQILSFDTLPQCVFGDSAFVLKAAASSGLPVVFQSENAAVANINGDTLTILGTGTVSIKAVQSGNDFYQSQEMTQTLTVHKADQQILFDTIPALTYGDASFELKGSSSSELIVTFKTLNDTVLTIEGSVATIIGAGSTYLIAEQIGNANYLTTADTQLVVVNKAAQTISFETPDSVDIEDELILEAFATSGLTVSYALDSKSGSINGNNITITGYEPITVVANQSGNKNYTAATSISKTIMVRKPNASLIVDGELSDTVYVNFGEVNLNTSAQKEIAVVNNGTGKLKLMIGESGYVNLSSPEGFNVDESGLTEIIAGKQQQAFIITFEPSVSGEFNSQATIMHSDPNKGNLVVVISGVGVETVNAITNFSQNIKLYPNPATEKFVIELESSDACLVNIHDAQGNIVYTNKNYITGNFINVSHLQSGVYIVSMHTMKKQVRFSRIMVK